MSIVDPPLYSPSTPAPNYHTQPLPDEQRLLYHVPRLAPGGTWRKQTPKATLILSDQENTAIQPTYGRNSVISGEIRLQDCEVLAIDIKVSVPVFAS
jgi:hypothetical protein